MSNPPIASAKNETDDNDAFTNFARRILSVPHSEIKAKLDGEKAAKRTPKRSASSDSFSPSNVRWKVFVSPTLPVNSA